MLPERLSSLVGKAAPRSRAGPIGFELAPETLHLLQLERCGAQTRIRALRSLRYPTDRAAVLGSAPALKALVREALRSRPFRGRRIVTALPAEELKLMVLNYEMGPGQSEPELILGLVQERISGGIESCVVDYVPIRTAGYDSGHRSALAAVARRDAVIDYLELLRGSGLRVEALEIAPVAVRRLVSELADGAGAANSLVLHCRRHRSHLTAVCGRRLMLYREIEFGVDHTIEQLGKALDMASDGATSVLETYGLFPEEGVPRSDPASALEISETVREILTPSFQSVAEQVRKAVVYIASQWRGASIDRIHLLGDVASWPGAGRLLSSLLSIPVNVPDPLSVLPLRRGAAEARDLDRAREIALAAGFALRGICDDG